MSKHNGQPPINPNGAGWPSTTGGKSGGGHWRQSAKKISFRCFQGEVMKSTIGRVILPIVLIAIYPNSSGKKAFKKFSGAFLQGIPFLVNK